MPRAVTLGFERDDSGSGPFDLETGYGAPELIDRLRQQVGRLDIDQKSWKAATSARLIQKPCSWPSEPRAKDCVPISPLPWITRSATSFAVSSHLPEAVLKSSYTGREADDIANLAFIGGKTNRAISDKPPIEYFPVLIAKSGVSAFETQCILTDPALLGVESYKLSFPSAER